MNKIMMLIAFILPFITKAQIKKLDSYPVYAGNDLGLSYKTQQSFFRIWAPTADSAELLLFNEGTGGIALRRISMQRSKSGTWIAPLPGEQKGKFYSFWVQAENRWLNEVSDLYAKAVGVNGRRALIVDLKETDPDEWGKDKSPILHNATDAVIYELHIRDASIAANFGIKHKGKYAGQTENGN